MIYNWEGACNLATGQFNVVSNYWRPGPNTRPYEKELPIQPKAEAQDVTTGFLIGNVFEAKPEWCTDNYAAFQWGIRGGKYSGEVTREKFTRSAELVLSADRPVTHSAEKAYELVLAAAGASKVRDTADERVVAGIKDRTHRRIDSQKEVGGWPALESGKAAKDTDRDGMPDEWELKHGLDSNNPIDGNAFQADGYTNLEHYINDND